MKREDYLKWFDDLAEKEKSVKYVQQRILGNTFTQPVEKDALEWITQAESALVSVFPETHPCRQAWQRVNKRIESSGATAAEHFRHFRGIFAGATNLLREGRLDSLIDTVRIEAEDELLDQATAFLEAKPRPFPVAAAVVAGGALETHLRHLV